MSKKAKDNNNELQDIWSIYTDVQEQMLRLRSAPMAIIPESAKIVGDKLYLTVDEDDKTINVINEIAAVFKIDPNEIEIQRRFFLSDIDLSQNITDDIRRKLSERASASYIRFQPYPVVDGYVRKKKTSFDNLIMLLDENNLDYRFDDGARLQIPITDLLILNNLVFDDATNILIPEVASAILPVSANLKYYIYKILPSLAEYNAENIKITDTITLNNSYFSNAITEYLSEEIELKLLWYKFIFKINSNVIGKYNPKTSPYQLPELNKDDNSFCFHIKIDRDYSGFHKPMEEEDLDFNFKYTRLKQFFDSFFGPQNVVFESVFHYSFNTEAFDLEFKKDMEITQFDNLTLSERSETIGVDFNWKNQSLEQLVSELEDKYHFIHFNLYKNHRCNFDFQLQDMGLEEAESQLRTKFPSIQTRRNDKKGTLYFYQEYQTIEQGYRLRQMIESEMQILDSKTLDFSLYSIPYGKEKYILEVDEQSKQEAITAAIKELRGYNFAVNGYEFGKLFRVNYPHMVFDISGSDFEKNKELFESCIIDSIEPNLTGDFEKIFRLRKSFENILRGKNLQNSKLKDFIFDAGKAEKIENVDYHISPISDTFCDLNNHLLNKKINLPQKQAIIKTLLAKDLALIQGPPGTGKSTAIAEIIWQHIRKNPQERILLTSETNLAVDNAIDKIVNANHNLMKPIRIGGEGKLEMEGRQFSLEVMKRWVENGTTEIIEDEQVEDEENLPQKIILQNWIDNIRLRADKIELNSGSLSLWNDILSNPSQKIRQILLDNYLKNCNVIGATCSSIAKTNSEGKFTNFYRVFKEIFNNNKDIVFTTVIEDEASKATPAELSIPLVYGKKNIIIGDHRQLPPMLDKEEFKLSLDFMFDKTIRDHQKKKIRKLKTFILKRFNEMEVSHFERLFNQIDDSLKGVFNLQYRMHPDINEVIKQFYIQDGGLQCGLITPVDLGVNSSDMSVSGSRYHGIEIDGLLSKDTHTIWIDTDSPELLDGTSRVNYGEIEAIRDVLTKFRQSEDFEKYQSFWSNPEERQIGLISFYGKQIKLLQNLRQEFSDIPIRVSTVDRFQGMERNIIIVSMVRSNRIATDKKQKADINLYGELGFPKQEELGFAQSPNRLNVALSRAKRLLIIVGNSELFRQKMIYNNVYNTIANSENGRIIKYKTQ